MDFDSCPAEIITLSAKNTPDEVETPTTFLSSSENTNRSNSASPRIKAPFYSALSTKY